MMGKTLLGWMLLFTTASAVCIADDATPAAATLNYVPNGSLPGDDSLFSKSTADAKVAKHVARVEKARVDGQTVERMDAWRDLVEARRGLDAMLENKLNEDPDFADAKKQYDRLAAASKVDSVPLEPIEYRGWPDLPIEANS